MAIRYSHLNENRNRNKNGMHMTTVYVCLATIINIVVAKVVNVTVQFLLGLSRAITSV